MVTEFAKFVYTLSWSLVGICGVASAFCLLVGDLSFCEIDGRKYFSLSKLLMNVVIICAIVGTAILFYTAAKEIAIRYENGIKYEYADLVDCLHDAIEKLGGVRGE